jgi:hypothetical protein
LVFNKLGNKIGELTFFIGEKEVLFRIPFLFPFSKNKKALLTFQMLKVLF